MSRIVGGHATLIKRYEKLIARLCLSLFLLGVNAPALAHVQMSDWHEVSHHAHEPGHDHGHSPSLTDDCDPSCHHGVSLVGITPSAFELLTETASRAFVSEVSSLLSLTRAPPIPPPNILIV